MAAYAQRTDLNSSAMTPQYGGAKALADAQKAVPMGASPTVTPPQVQRTMPGTLGALTRSPERPNEPITAGANCGAGPNAIAAGIPMPTGDQALAELRAIYAMYPNDDLADLIDSATREGL